MALSQERKRAFRALGHALNPVVTLSDKGITSGVLAETARALDDHELIKIRVSVSDRSARQMLIESICSETGAELVQTIGKVALLFKKAKQPNPKLSNLVRQIPGK